MSKRFLLLAHLKTGLLAGFLLLVNSCAVAPQTEFLRSQTLDIPVAHEMLDVTFFPQEQFYCGPTTIAEVLNFYGHDLVPEQIAPSLFIPGREGSLQLEMVAAVRQYGLLAYAERGSLRQLFSLVSDDIPVVVLQNLGTSWYPRWHYALVIGYDLEDETVVLHTGVTERRRAPMNVFENTWRRGDYWLLAAVPPAKSSVHFDRFMFTRAAHDLIEVGQTDAAIRALESASQQWSDYYLPFLLLGNHYLDQDASLALNWYEKGLGSGSGNTSYLNNYAFALLRNGNRERALRAIQQALALDPHNQQLQQSLQEISEVR